jgi:hypothetical protein
MERIAEASLRPRARVTGAVYLLYFLTAVFGGFFIRGIVISGDAAATANNIMAHEPLCRLGLATGLVSTACYIAVTALLYDLFKPVGRSSPWSRHSSASSGAPFRLSAASFNSPPCWYWGANRT